MIEQRRHIVGEVLVGDVACDVRRASVALHFDGNHFPRFGELADPPGPVAGDGHERAVEQYHRFAAAVDFVVHGDSVDWHVARNGLLLRRRGSRQKHRHEKSGCPHDGSVFGEVEDAGPHDIHVKLRAVGPRGKTEEVRPPPRSSPGAQPW